jgi:hypothetical protein
MGGGSAIQSALLGEMYREPLAISGWLEKPHDWPVLYFIRAGFRRDVQLNTQFEPDETLTGHTHQVALVP